jgi:hypothetical protein
MGRTCSTYVRKERCIHDFGGGNPRKGDHLEDPGVDRKVILKWMFEKWVGGARTGSIRLRTGTCGVLL